MYRVSPDECVTYHTMREYIEAPHSPDVSGLIYLPPPQGFEKPTVPTNFQDPGLLMEIGV